eukprot:TRINITY_DN10858_c0_g1_i1.p1 TRINITY_DN10858_c0_g1~~TRINITY_DN10858_c0_g1_i1.p1  ORF type:complete len:173 (+),score=79.96 TRINITY_DN10858_c0_g1_i1:2-520(+)
MSQASKIFVEEEQDAVSFKKLAVGGTFDHLHDGHRILLSACAHFCTQTLIIGLTNDVMLKNKKYAEFLETYQQREKACRDYIKSLKPNLNVEVHSIVDAYGPTATDPDIEALVVSEETRKGGDAVNDLRKEKGFKTLEIICVGCAGNPNDPSEEKMSSTYIRKQLHDQKNKK